MDFFGWNVWTLESNGGERMSFDYSELIDTKKRGEKIINLHKAGYDSGSYFFIVSWGNNGLFDEKQFNDLESAKRFFNKK